MLLKTPELKASLLDQVLALVREKLSAPQAGLAERFVLQYYGQVDPEDLAERSVEDLYGAALAQFHFGRKFSRGAAKIRVYNPSLEEHGWRSTHTVIEVVTDDMPFLVDSVTMEVNRHGLTLHLFIHPQVKTVRDAKGELKDLLAPGADATEGLESVMHVEVDRQAGAALETLQADIERVLADVRVAVDDWARMKQAMVDVVEGLKKAPPVPLDAGELDEAREFLQWLVHEHFTFLGVRDYDLLSKNGEDVLKAVAGSGLGIMREKAGEPAMSASFAALPPEARALARKPELLIITKANSRATVHRPGYHDYVGIKRFDAKGQVIGERRFIGLYTSTAYSASPWDIPLLRRKVAGVMKRAGFLPRSHMEKALLAILETYPRDELFQIAEEELFNNSLGILHLGERQRMRLFVREDLYGRFLSCLIYVPRENYNTDLRQRMQRVLMKAFNGVSSEFNVQLSESVLARILIMVRTRPGTIPRYDVPKIEQELVQVARRWQDDLRQALVSHFGEERGSRLYKTFENAFPAGYREEVSPRAAVHDIELIESMGGDNDLAMSLYIPVEAEPGTLRFKIFHAGTQVALSSSLPMLERMGVKVVDERPSKIEPEGRPPVWLHDFGMTCGADVELEIERIKGIFQESFGKVWHGQIENDDFNRLVLLAQLNWRDIVILRAYCKYLRQAGFNFSQAYMEQTMAHHPKIARMLAQLFHARFDPAARKRANGRAGEIAGEIEQALDQVANLDEDRILRQFLAVIQATLRTNFFQKGADGRPKAYLSFKFDPRKVPGLPEPKPMFEISVYSRRMEGVHLRGGRVARGGLRWSDRMEDFRTEVLGLMKAQMVKNAVIVPVGSKGGFVLKCPPPAGDREALMKEGIACYQTFLRGLLDLTDNLVSGKVVPPPDVVRHDQDDPYLVVAADKGTATFSDIANGVSKEYGFWLGDAFASGGSAGYDHKKMGITARGAWESVKRHFREMGLDCQTTDFTCVGVGDMSGDVFGNGMLLSRHTRLLAAFDHRHIFIDPDPDPEASFKERARLFALPRSSWDDYDKKLISKGGGIFPKSAKSIALSPEARRALGIDAESLTPNDLVKAILKAPVDVLYNGGIGTYVKASAQSHAEVGDRGNDPVRVNGKELRCKMVGEGGNLGFTQLGRVEYALAGGRINTDAIDNSGGVDCSDHEVNIKILLSLVTADGELTEKQRNKLLADMTDEVAALVLRDNYFQNQSLSVSGVRAVALLDGQARFMRFLEKAGKLNRTIEYLPAEEEIAERKAAKLGLTCPERAVLLAYSKIWLYDDLLASDVPEDAYLSTALERYFPRALRERFKEHIWRHPLKREIIATHVVNSMVNRVGSTFVHRLLEETGAKASDIVRAYILTREVFGTVDLWKAVEALDNKVADSVQSDMVIEVGRLIVRSTLWFLRSLRGQPEIAKIIARFGPGVTALASNFDRLLTPAEAEALRQAQEKLTAQGVPAELARRVAALEFLYAALDLVEAAEETDRDVDTAAAVYFSLGGALNLAWLRRQVSLLPAESHWQTLAKAAMRDDLSGIQRLLATAALKLSPKVKAPDKLIQAWEERNHAGLDRCRQVLADLQSGTADLAMLSVALREIRGLV
ncbi:MAG: NAD-glutamate dehydrogenase [Betaproteobacteria bacterium]|nr:NAD-glutamate dehydrogenase [Betaproteobacteria bacterium]